jgi:integrase
MKRAARHKRGSVVFDKRRRTWNFLWWEQGKRRSRLIGTLQQYRSKGAARQAAASFQHSMDGPKVSTVEALTVGRIIEQYRAEKMPERYSTRRSYESWIRNHVLPAWRAKPLSELQARPVELWLQALALSPKSKASVRGLLRTLWDHAMWRGDIATQRNPMELVTIKGVTKRTRQPRSLAVEDFQKFIEYLEEPFRTIALICVCFGLRISECLALRWSDVDWLNGRLRIERGIVRQRVGETKTTYSNRPLLIDAEMLEVLKRWRQRTQFSGDGDWIFASPAQLGRLPWSADSVNDAYLKAGLAAGIGRVSTHCMRHTYRSWLDAVGTPIAVQQKLMRHADIRTTMNIYGDIVTDEMAVASSKVAGLALNGLRADRKAS